MPSIWNEIHCQILSVFINDDTDDDYYCIIIIVLSIPSELILLLIITISCMIVHIRIIVFAHFSPWDSWDSVSICQGVGWEATSVRRGQGRKKGLR